MSRINTNVSSLIAQRVLSQNNDSLNTSLERLSTGLKINSGADDPAGLIAANNLKSDQAGITQAIDNAGRANNIIGTAEGGLSEVSNLLTQLQSLVNQSANTGGLSKEEVDANQLQVDSILSTVNRLSQATSFQGTKLLNGNFAYTTSGINSTQFDNVSINSAAHSRRRQRQCRCAGDGQRTNRRDHILKRHFDQRRYAGNSRNQWHRAVELRQRHVDR